MKKYNLPNKPESKRRIYLKLRNNLIIILKWIKIKMNK